MNAADVDGSSGSNLTCDAGCGGNVERSGILIVLIDNLSQIGSAHDRVWISKDLIVREDDP